MLPEPTVTLEVLCLETGDRAEAEDEAGMLMAARTLIEDADTTYGARRRLTVAFIVNGVTVVTRKGVEL